MNINYDIDLNAGQTERLMTILDCTEAQLPNTLSQYAKAATMEYLQMFLGMATLRAASECRELRLLMMIENVFPDNMPDEYTISRIFQIPVASARTLSKNVWARYQFELKTYITDSYVEAVETSQLAQDEQAYEVSVKNSAVIEGLNQILLSIDAGLPNIGRKLGTTGTYLIDLASYARLREHFGLDAEEQNENG